MSVELILARGNEPGVEDTTVGGNKPLHRFMRGQPKATGVAVLVMGSAFFIISISIMSYTTHFIWTVIPPGFILGVQFITCGILYIVTGHNPTKKTVTISCALSIVSVLGSVWTILQILANFGHNLYDYSRHTPSEFLEENFTNTHEFYINYLEVEMSLELVYLFYNIVGIIVLIVMSSLAGAALRPTKSQAIVMMTTAPTETPAEQQPQEDVEK